jgi:uncharacterized protein (UPF0264 family)
VLPGRRGWFVKFALHHEPGADQAIRAGVERLRSRPDAPRLILARYADQGLGDGAAWLTLAAGNGAWGVLVDTSGKDGGSLFHFVSAHELTGLARQARQHELRFALAGGLAPDHLEVAGATGAHIVGVRGAACEGGRAGRLSEARVDALSRRLGALTAPRVPGVLLASPP